MTLPLNLGLGRPWARLIAALLFGYAWHLAFDVHADHAPRAVLPNAVVDLRTTEGVARVKAQWRYSDTHIQEIDHRSVGPDLRASGPKNRTFDFTPDAHAADFDDSKWEAIPADSLEKRRGNGRLSFNWYRLDVTIPEKVGGFDTRGSTAVFEIVVDDYAEVWVNDGEGYLLFSDPNNNAIYRMTTDGDVQVYVTKSGYAGGDIGEYGSPAPMDSRSIPKAGSRSASTATACRAHREERPHTCAGRPPQ
ncbi:MAG: hypothetical protein HY301_06980 [Verrucomicrobia bacterium]|nr:hypothetical protein [Verrucomicrobiota bacterium]